MAYRSDFYIPENIIGYTGNINNNPTVYFAKGTSFGHITQHHDVPQNIGRGHVFQAQGYAIRNEQGTCHEYIGGWCFHRSRSVFVSIETLGFASKYKLSLAIPKHVLKKQYDDYTEAERDQIEERGYVMGNQRFRQR